MEKERKSNEKLFYRATKHIKGKKKNSLITANGVGEILTKATEIIELWNQYFQAVLVEEPTRITEKLR